MSYNVYQDGNLIAEEVKNKEYTVEDLEPNTEYSFSVSEVIVDNESVQSDTITITTDYSDVESVTVAPKNNNLEVGATRSLNATVSPDTAPQEVNWSSSDEGVATVSDGTITATGAGEATITVTVEGKSDTATVNVTESEPDPEAEDPPEEPDDPEDE